MRRKACLPLLPARGQRKGPHEAGLILVPETGVEPATYALRMRPKSTRHEQLGIVKSRQVRNRSPVQPAPPASTQLHNESRINPHTWDARDIALERRL